MMPTDDESIGVTFFHRKPRSVANYSVEAIFEDVRARLSGIIRARVSVARFPSSGLFKRLYICLEAFLRRDEVNHVTGDINFVGLLLPKNRTVQTILDCGSIQRASGVRRALLKLVWLTWPVQRCAVVTAISEATKQEILRLVPGCPPQKIVVVPVAISRRYQAKPRVFNAAKPRILQVGATSNKNVPRLIQALRGIPCHLDIIGMQVTEYMEMLRANGIEFTYRWNLPEEEVIQAYEAADIVSFASTYEGFGMPILEGQATGRPVVTSNVLSMPEVAGAGARLVDPFDVDDIRRGILQVTNDREYRDHLVRQGFENVKRFDPEVIARAYLDIYRKIARPPK